MTVDHRQAEGGGSPGTGPRLGLFLNMPMHATETGLTARYPHLFDFFFALAGRTQGTWLALPLKRGGARRPEYGPVPLPANVHIVGLPHWHSAPMLVRRIGLVYPAAVWSLARNLRRWDVVGAVVPGIIGNLFITAARATGTPVFLLVRGEKQRTVAWMFGESRSKPFFVWALRQMERPVRRWVKKGVPTFVAGEELALRYRVPRANVHNLYPGLSSDFPFASSPRTSRSAAHDGPLRLITVSRLSLEKGIDDLLRAVDLLRAQSVGASLTVIGEGPDRDRLESVAAGLGLDGLVDFRGFVPHGPELVRALDEAEVFVLPSKSEGLPHSLVEAMARALPVVTTTIGGMPALLADGGGLLVEPGDPQGLAAAIARLGGDTQERAALSARSLQKAQAFSPDRILEEFCVRLGVTYPQLGWPASAGSS